MNACEVVIAEFVYGSQTCGVEATKTVPGEFEAEKYFVCDEHYAEYFGDFLEREYTYHQMINEEGTQPMYFSDPKKCSHCQNNGHHDEYLVAGKCHRCEARAIMQACITANVRRGDVALALSQMRMIGI